MNPPVSIVVPTRNEQGNVEPLAEAVASAFADRWRWQLVFVDDSSDDTPRRIEALIGADLPVRLLHRAPGERVGGLGGAVLAGFEVADGDVLVVMDGDLQHPPELASKLASTVALGVADVAIASRFVAGASARGLSSPYRHVVTGASRRLAHLAVPRSRGIRDPLSGFFAVRADVLASGPFRSDGFKVLLDVLAEGSWRSAVEIPFELEARHSGSSKAELSEGLRFLRQLARHRAGAVAPRQAEVALAP